MEASNSLIIDGKTWSVNDLEVIANHLNDNLAYKDLMGVIKGDNNVAAEFLTSEGYVSEKTHAVTMVKNLRDLSLFAVSKEKEDEEYYGEEKLETVGKAMVAGIPVGTRTYHLKKYTSCFLGTEAVEFLIVNKHASDTADALRLGNVLLKRGIFFHVARDHDLKNEKLFYRFRIHESHGQTPAEVEGSSRPDTWQDVLENIGKDMFLIEEEEFQTNKFSKFTDINSKFNHVPEVLLDEHNVKLLDHVRPTKWIDPAPEGKYNLIAIGGGAGGLVSSIGCGILGGRAAVIERLFLGGDCLNTGCVPSKAILKSAKIAHEVKNAAAYGVNVSGVEVDFTKVMGRVRERRAAIAPHDAAKRFADQYGVDVYFGDAKFIDKNTIEVNGQRLQFAKCCIATGGRPRIPNIPGIKDIRYFTSENVFNITEKPENMVIIGAGPIGCELAQAFQRLGVQVTILMQSFKFLPREDPDAADIVERSLVKDGVNFFKGVKIRGVRKNGSVSSDCIVEITTHAGENVDLPANALLIAAGRVPNIENMGLEEANVKYERTGIVVNDCLQTSNSNIYAVGDVASKYQFTHMSDAMARIVIKNALFFKSEKVSQIILPWCTYTDPEIAHVGKYPGDLEAEGTKFDTYTKEFKENDRAICDSNEIGYVKIHTKAGTDQILGATIVGHGAGDLITEITLSMQNKLGLTAISNTVHPYPTYAETTKQCAGQIGLTRLTLSSKKFLRGLLSWRR